MDKRILADDRERIEDQTGVYLLVAGIISIFSILLIVTTFLMSWELWTIPLIVIGVAAVWVFHIGKMVTDAHYEYLCTGFMTVEIFYYGIHSDCLFDVPIIVCILFFLLALLRKKSLLYLVEAMYVLTLLYHLLFLDTIGTDIGVGNAVRLFLGAAGTVGAMALSGAMIGRRKDEQKEMRRMAEQLTAAEQKNADFLSNVSHELRTPINMVTGISEVALGKDISPEVRESMLSIQKAGKRLAGQINNILDYTEIAGDTLVVTNENYMPSSLIHDILTAAALQSGDHDLEMVFDVDPKLPSVLIGDVEKISRIIRILLQNAIKFTKEGGFYIRVGGRKESYGVNLDITIHDTGIGMDALQLSHIYDNFYQADSGRSRLAGGLGLGISIAQGLLYAMEGFIHYESEEDKGTRIHITIPQGIADDTPCMEVTNPKENCVVCYINPEKYSRSEVRDYYNAMIQHMAEGLEIEAYRAYHFEDLENLMKSHELTHLFLGQEEYEKRISYFEELGAKLCVVLIAGKNFIPQRDSSLIFLQKPFFALPIVNLLNRVTHGRNLGESMTADGVFSCAGVHALVVDDEEMNLVVARGILNSYGIQVDTCLSGAAAIAQCMNVSYHLIFLDHMMPEMDGVETLKRIRRIKEGLYQNLPIVALTANAISGAREMFLGEGFTEFVPKPIERTVLERVLRKVIPEQYIRYRSAEESLELPDETPEPSGLPDETPEPSGLPDETPEPSGLPDETPEPSGLPDDFLARLKQSGINVKIGLDYCGGAEDFYLDMLQMFCAQRTEKREEIVRLYESGDWADYAVKVHALKSTSLTIGAEELSGRAKALEQAGKTGDQAYIRENHADMITLYDAVCMAIAAAVRPEGNQEGGDAL